eukprot:723821-Pyramimonas_sp.AAC.1
MVRSRCQGPLRRPHLTTLVPVPLNSSPRPSWQIMNNAEINAIKQILGLQHGKQYQDVKSLRYGHLMIMTDQDHDGSHIKGLLINFLHHFFPRYGGSPSRRSRIREFGGAGPPQ